MHLAKLVKVVGTTSLIKNKPSNNETFRHLRHHHRRRLRRPVRQELQREGRHVQEEVRQGRQEVLPDVRQEVRQLHVRVQIKTELCLIEK